MKIERILVVAAHPDDEVLGCGGTIHKLLDQGAAIRVLVVGEGSSCRYPLEELDTPAARNSIEQRRSFAYQAAKRLGIDDLVLHDFPCGRFDQIPIIDIGKLIEEHIADFQPDTLFTHNGQDTNSDHRITFNASLAATRPTPGHPVKQVLSFEILSSTEWRFEHAFTPNLFFDIGSHVDAKIEAFACYQMTEGRPFPFPRCEEGLRTQARMRGMQVGLPYAEAFQAVRVIVS